MMVCVLSVWNALGASHDCGPYSLVGGQPLSCVTGDAVRHGMGDLGSSKYAHRCIARPVGCSGNYPYTLPRPSPTDRREPGDLSTGNYHALSTWGQDYARLLLLWRKLRLCAVRRRN